MKSALSNFQTLPLKDAARQLLAKRGFCRALIEADREMPGAELRTTSRSLPTSTFEIDALRFPSGSFQSSVCLTSFTLRAARAGYLRCATIHFRSAHPSNFAPGTTSDDLVCLVDLAATAAAVAGEKLPDGAAPDSFNLLPTLLGQPQQMKRDTLVVMSGNGDLAIRQGQWKYLPNLALADGWQSGPKKPNQAAQPALFDLSTDQGETKNLVQQTALRDSALLQSGASSQVVSEAKDKPAIARRMAELLEKAQSAKSTRPSSP